MSEWDYNDDNIPDDDLLYRRVLDRPGMLTYDPVDNLWSVHPGAFRREVGNDLSAHLHSILIGRGRVVTTLYPAPYGSVRFEVGVPRRHDAGVLLVEDPAEADADLAAAHAEVRPGTPEKNKVHWKNVANEVARACCWVVYPESNVSA